MLPTCEKENPVPVVLGTRHRREDVAVMGQTINLEIWKEREEGISDLPYDTSRMTREKRRSRAKGSRRM